MLPCAYTCLAFHSRLFFVTKAYSFLHHCLPTIALSSYSSILEPFRVALFRYQGTHSSMLSLLHAQLHGISSSLPMHHPLIHTWLSAVSLFLPLTKALTCLRPWPFMVAHFLYQGTLRYLAVHGSSFFYQCTDLSILWACSIVLFAYQGTHPSIVGFLH